MDKQVIENLTKYINAITKQYKISKIILYGSFAEGKADENSDIDLAIFIEDPAENYLSVSAGLFSFVWNIDSRIEPILFTSYKDRSGFLESILKKGKVIFHKGKLLL